MVFKSLQSRLLLALALPVVILSQRKKLSVFNFFAQTLLYLALAYNADCLISGNCRVWAWLAVLVPIINTLGYLFFTDDLNIEAPIDVPVPRGLEQGPWNSFIGLQSNPNSESEPLLQTPPSSSNTGSVPSPPM